MSAVSKSEQRNVVRFLTDGDRLDRMTGRAGGAQPDGVVRNACSLREIIVLVDDYRLSHVVWPFHGLSETIHDFEMSVRIL